MGYTKLAPVIEAGAETLHVIYVDPDIKQVPIHELKSSLNTFYRVFLITWAAMVNQGIESVVRTNNRIRTLKAVRKKERLSQESFEQLLRSYLPPDRKPGSIPAEVTLHRYRPADDLFGPLGLMNLNRQRLEKLIKRGFEDAAHHDCDANECVRPNSE